MADIKLYYFNARIRAEFVRLALLVSGRDFQDVRVSEEGPEKWGPEWKAKAPFGQLPYLEYKGKRYGQSVALGNFVAREFGLYGKSSLDALRIDEVMQLAEDLKAKLVDYYHEDDKAKKAELYRNITDEQLEKTLSFLEGLLQQNGSSGFFVGNSVTLADLVAFDVCDYASDMNAGVLEKFQLLAKLRANVQAIPAVRDYLATRPMTDI